RRSVPMSRATARSAAWVSVFSRMPASARARSSAAAVPASAAVDGAVRPRRDGAVGRVPLAVRGVRALMGERSPGDRVAVAVGRPGRVGGGGVDAEQLAVHLDVRAVGPEAGGVTLAGAGRAGYDDVVAVGDGGDFGGHGRGQLQPRAGSWDSRLAVRGVGGHGTVSFVVRSVAQVAASVFGKPATPRALGRQI